MKRLIIEGGILVEGRREIRVVSLKATKAYLSFVLLSAAVQIVEFAELLVGGG